MLRYFMGYTQQPPNATILQKVIFVLTIGLIGYALINAPWLGISILCAGLVSYKIEHFVNEVRYITQYRYIISKGSTMNNSSIQSKISRLDARTKRLMKSIQDVHKKIKQLNSEATTIRRQRIAGILAERANPGEILTKERRLHAINNELRSLKHSENNDRHELDKEKAELRLVRSMYERALHGDTHAKYQAEQLLSHY